MHRQANMPWPTHPPVSFPSLSSPLQAVESLESGRFETVHLAAGCFWGLELALQRTRGVVGSSVGYTQGEKESPTYSEVCSGACALARGDGLSIHSSTALDPHAFSPSFSFRSRSTPPGATGHTEAAEVIYDPKEISFEELLEVFWRRHNPTQVNWLVGWLAGSGRKTACLGGKTEEGLTRRPPHVSIHPPMPTHS